MYESQFSGSMNHIFSRYLIPEHTLKKRNRRNMISLAGHMAHFGLEFIITFLFILANVFVTIEMGIIGNAPEMYCLFISFLILYTCPNFKLTEAQTTIDIFGQRRVLSQKIVGGQGILSFLVKWQIQGKTEALGGSVLALPSN